MTGNADTHARATHALAPPYPRRRRSQPSHPASTAGRSRSPEPGNDPNRRGDCRAHGCAALCGRCFGLIEPLPAASGGSSNLCTGARRARQVCARKVCTAGTRSTRRAGGGGCAHWMAAAEANGTLRACPARREKKARMLRCTEVMLRRLTVTGTGSIRVFPKRARR